jgi:hypothetical protein
MNTFRPEQWHDFYLMVGGGAAALTGLVVVAMSLRLDLIVQDLALRHRARIVLIGLAAVFMRSALVLMGGQNGLAVGAELAGVCLIVTAAVVASLAQVLALDQPAPQLSRSRTLGNIGLYLAEITGGVLLMLGVGIGIYLAAMAMVANFYFMIAGCWLLLVGVSQDEVASESLAEVSEAQPGGRSRGGNR